MASHICYRTSPCEAGFAFGGVARKNRPIPAHATTYVAYLAVSSSSIHRRGFFVSIASFRIVLILYLAKLAPAGVLLGFGGVRILVVLQPEAEPVHRSALRGHAHGWVG